MDISDSFISLVDAVGNSRRSFILVPCSVLEVNEDKRSCSCRALASGERFDDVLLQAFGSAEVGLVFFPQKDSVVLVGSFAPARYVALSFTAISKAVFTIGETEIVVQDKSISIVNGKVKANIAEDSLKLDVDGTTLEMDGSVSTWNGGSETTANANDLKKQLTTMSGRIDALFNAIKSGVPAPMDGGAAYKTSMIGILAAASQKEDFSNIIDDKIKH